MRRVCEFRECGCAGVRSTQAGAFPHRGVRRAGLCVQRGREVLCMAHVDRLCVLACGDVEDAAKFGQTNKRTNDSSTSASFEIRHKCPSVSVNPSIHPWVVLVGRETDRQGNAGQRRARRGEKSGLIETEESGVQVGGGTVGGLCQAACIASHRIAAYVCIHAGGQTGRY